MKVARGAALLVAYLNRLLNSAEPSAKLVINKDFHFTASGREGTFWNRLLKIRSQSAVRLPRMDWTFETPDLAGNEDGTGATLGGGAGQSVGLPRFTRGVIASAAPCR